MSTYADALAAADGIHSLLRHIAGRPGTKKGSRVDVLRYAELIWDSNGFDSIPLTSRKDWFLYAGFDWTATGLPTIPKNDGSVSTLNEESGRR